MLNFSVLGDNRCYARRRPFCPWLLHYTQFSKQDGFCNKWICPTMIWSYRFREQNSYSWNKIVDILMVSFSSVSKVENGNFLFIYLFLGISGWYVPVYCFPFSPFHTLLFSPSNSFTLSPSLWGYYRWITDVSKDEETIIIAKGRSMSVDNRLSMEGVVFEK